MEDDGEDTAQQGSQQDSYEGFKQPGRGRRKSSGSGSLDEADFLNLSSFLNFGVLQAPLVKVESVSL